MDVDCFQPPRFHFKSCRTLPLRPGLLKFSSLVKPAEGTIPWLLLSSTCYRLGRCSPTSMISSRILHFHFVYSRRLYFRDAKTASPQNQSHMFRRPKAIETKQDIAEAQLSVAAIQRTTSTCIKRDIIWWFQNLQRCDKVQKKSSRVLVRVIVLPLEGVRTSELRNYRLTRAPLLV